MRGLVEFFDKHCKGIMLLLAACVALLTVITHMSVTERRASEAVHAKLDYEAQLFKFIILERGCGCK